MENKPLSLEDAKDQVAKKHGYENWKSIHWYVEDHINERTGPYSAELYSEEAAELYAQSRVTSLELQLKQLQEENKRLTNKIQKV